MLHNIFIKNAFLSHACAFVLFSYGVIDHLTDVEAMSIA